MLHWLKTSEILESLNMKTKRFIACENLSDDGRSLEPQDGEEYESARIEALKMAESLRNHLVAQKIRTNIQAR
ncbi:MAG: hypothetical protein LBL21_01005 [Rickettsiales bacterium]|jgi:hypothetical protein|nr:hypothetical protein [Rickettsiales bacterium]